MIFKQFKENTGQAIFQETLNNIQLWKLMTKIQEAHETCQALVPKHSKIH